MTSAAGPSPPPRRFRFRDQASVYGSALAAIVLPLVTWRLLHSAYGLLLAERLAEIGFTGRMIALSSLALLILEIRWMDVLVGLLSAKGSAARLLAHRSTPDFLARRRRLHFAITATSISALMTLGAAEIIFRALGIRPPPPPQSLTADRHLVDDTRNVLGIREDWPRLETNDPRLRILFLGDSMVYGDGVERDECFCHFVEMLLADAVPEGVVTINLGYPGTNPAWQLEKYKRLRYELAPDIIVHVAYPNDLGIDMHSNLDEIYRVRDDDLWVGNVSRVLSYAERQIRYKVAWRRTIDYFRGGSDSSERDAAWAKFEADLFASRNTAWEDGAYYVLIQFPWLVRLSEYPLKEVHERMRGVAERLRVPYLDLLPTFLGRDGETLRVTLANEHPNPEGHRIAAERIAQFLREEVLPSVHP